MIQSMTGYSRCVRQTPQGTVTAELRSTNHRYLEVEQRLPEGLAGFEGEAVDLIRSQLRRGRIDMRVALHTPRGASQRIVVDEAIAQACYESLVELKSRFGLKGEVTLDQLLAHPRLFSAREDQSRRQELWPPVRQAIAIALRDLLATRRREGQRLVKDIRAQVLGIHKHLVAIRARLPASVKEQKRRLGERLKALLGPSAATQAQIQEALAMLKDTDIHEELVRLESHLSHLRHVVASRQAIGKKLDFIAQELMREANTMGAKANDADIVRHVIEIKGAIEKIREQAQNLE